jgi:hypothetical protein
MQIKQGKSTTAISLQLKLQIETGKPILAESLEINAATVSLWEGYSQRLRRGIPIRGIYLSLMRKTYQRLHKLKGRENNQDLVSIADR